MNPADAAPPPEGLAERGRRMWSDSQGMWLLTPAHLVLLEEACRLADRLDVLDALLRAAAGQEFAALAPVLAESRQQSLALRQLLAEIRQGSRARSKREASGVTDLAGRIAARRAASAS